MNIDCGVYMGFGQTDSRQLYRFCFATGYLGKVSYLGDLIKARRANCNSLPCEVLLLLVLHIASSQLLCFVTLERSLRRTDALSSQSCVALDTSEVALFHNLMFYNKGTARTNEMYLSCLVLVFTPELWIATKHYHPTLNCRLGRMQESAC